MFLKSNILKKHRTLKWPNIWGLLLRASGNPGDSDMASYLVRTASTKTMIIRLTPMPPNLEIVHGIEGKGFTII